MAERAPFLFVFVSLLTAGCGAHYATPGRGANLQELTADLPRAG